MIYSYKCEKCGVEEDRLVNSTTADEQYCNKCDCKEKMTLIPTFSTAIQFKGKWFSNSGEY